MAITDSPETRKRLIVEYGYSERGADVVLKSLSSLSPALESSVDLWWNEKVPITMQAEGKTIAQLRSEFGMNDLAAILTLNWILADPEAALSSLSKGIDQVR